MTARRELTAITVVGALLAFFAVGVYRVLSWQAAMGDDFPPYSSLRSDPLGLRVLYETIQQLRGVTAERLYQPLTEHCPPTPGTIIVAGVNASLGSVLPTAEQLATFAQMGGVLVIAWSSGAGLSATSLRSPADPSRHPPWATADILDTWGVALRRGSAQMPQRASDGWPWHSPLYFRCIAPDWEVWLECEGQPVLVSRPWQRGRVVLASDSYLFSNEGLLRHRRTELLSRMLSGPTIWFAEAHLGVRRSPDWRDYVGRLRLRAAGWVMVAFAGLALWSALVPLLPSRPATMTLALHGAGQPHDGFLDLLRRHIPPARLPEVFRKEWQRFCAPSNPAAAARLATAASPQSDHPPLETLRELYSQIQKKERSSVPSSRPTIEPRSRHPNRSSQSDHRSARGD